MNDGALLKSAQLINDMSLSRRAKHAHIVWHGGEPLTVPVQWYEKASEILTQKNEGLTQTMQTSLIPYTSEYAHLTHDLFDSHLGSSIDFSQRQIKGSSERYQDLWLKKVELARSDGIDITPGMVPTTKDVELAAQHVDWFVSNGFSHFNIDRYSCFGDKSFPDYPNNAQHAQFMINLFDRVMQLMLRKGSAPTVNVITTVINGIQFGIPGDRWGGTCQSDFVIIEPDGTLNSCPDRVSFEPSFGHLDSGFQSFAASPERKNWIRIQSIGHQNNYCEQCENNSWCKTGCPITSNQPELNGDECSGYKKYITHVRQFISKNPNLIEIYMNQGLTS
jgi:radical SAM protein with 4Fe4S-binding SPASM domain